MTSKELEQHLKFKSIVESGGAYWKCKECPQGGVLTAESKLAIALRETSGVASPDPVGIEFDTCDQHTPDE